MLNICSEEGYGSDYVPAEYIYGDVKNFRIVPGRYGFELIEIEPRLRNIAGC